MVILLCGGLCAIIIIPRNCSMAEDKHMEADSFIAFILMYSSKPGTG